MRLEYTQTDKHSSSSVYTVYSHLPASPMEWSQAIIVSALLITLSMFYQELYNR